MSPPPAEARKDTQRLGLHGGRSDIQTRMEEGAYKQGQEEQQEEAERGAAAETGGSDAGVNSSSTFYKSVQISLSEPVGSMSVSPGE